MIPATHTSRVAIDAYGLSAAETPAVRSRTVPLPWRIMFAALVLTVVEGAIRKWVIGSGFQSGSYLAYFSKDIVFALIVFLPTRDSSEALDYFRRWLIPGCFLLLCGALSSATQELIPGGAVLTLRAAVVLPILAYMTVRRTPGMSLGSVAWLIGALTILNFALGVLQNQLSPSHWLNRYAADTLEITMTETGVRATGTFSYITGMAVFSTVGVWAGMVLLSIGRNVRQQMFGWAVVACGFGCGLASVSRGPVYMGIIIIVLWMLWSGNWAANKPRSLVAAALLLGVVALFGVTTTFFDLGHGLILRAENSEDTAQERGLGQFAESLVALDKAPFGSGLGSEQVGRFHYIQGELTRTTFESQLPRIVLETGVIGLVGFLVICAGALLALQVSKFTASSGEKAALLAAQLFLVSMFASNVIFNHVASAFTWIIFAAVMASCAAKVSAIGDAIHAPF